MSHLENNYIFGFLVSRWLIWLIWKWHSSTFNFWPPYNITLWGNIDAPYLKLLNDASVASAYFYVRTCRRVRNSKKIATIRDFHLPGSFLCLSTRLQSFYQHPLTHLVPRPIGQIQLCFLWVERHARTLGHHFTIYSFIWLYTDN